MYYREFYPFYVAYANPLLYDGEKMQEEEFALMKAYYPETARRIQEKVEEKCDLMDYEGSRLYDEFPDRLMLRRLCGEIRREIMPAAEMEAVSGNFLDDLIQVLLFPGNLQKEMPEKPLQAQILGKMRSEANSYLIFL